jgi:hypothetical protein
MKRINYYDHLHKLALERYNTRYIAGLTDKQRSELIGDTYEAMRERQLLINLNKTQINEEY